MSESGLLIVNKAAEDAYDEFIGPDPLQLVESEKELVEIRQMDTKSDRRLRSG